MALRVTRLRRWFAAGAIFVIAVVAGAYYFAKWRVENALKQVPGKLDIQIQQTAQGFTVSKSEGGRTLFKIQASKVVQFKQGGRAELHDVAITLYGKESNRFDQIYGSDFEYNQQTGDVIARGDVQIDLEANPEGIVGQDQAVPKELKNPIHLRTSGLTFNQKTGNAATNEKVEFRIPQATGTAVGASYTAKDNVLVLHSDVRVEFAGPNSSTLTAASARVTKSPNVILLDHPRIASNTEISEADQARLSLRKDNNVDRVLAEGNVRAESLGTSSSSIRSAKLEILMGAARNQLRSATFSGNVQMESTGDQPMDGRAGRVVLSFNGRSVSTVHTEENVNFVQHQKAAGPSSPAQDVELRAPVVDFFMTRAHKLQRAETSGPPQIAIRPTGTNAPAQETLATASKFEAAFDKAGRLTGVHGVSGSRIVTTAPNQPDRESTSDTLDATFRPGKGIESLVQQGNFAYMDGERKAWAARARYTPADHILYLTGSPRVEDGGMTTTARSMRMDRSTGDALAEGDLKSTYSDLKPQPGGALLASSSPIHVTAKKMTAHKSPAVALYSGSVRLWQDANVIEAPAIDFDRDHRAVIAHSSSGSGQLVSTILVQTDKSGRVIPAKVTSNKLTYTDSDRKAHFEGNTVAKWTDLTITATQMDAFFQRADQKAPSQAPSNTGKLEKIVATGNVVIVQPKRQANGDQLVYTTADDKFVLTGGPPSIFDAEQGKITGVSLTLFRHDDRVLVEGNAASPVVTQTRVAR